VIGAFTAFVSAFAAFLTVLMPLALAHPGYFMVVIAMFLGFFIFIGHFALLATALSLGLFPAPGAVARRGAAALLAGARNRRDL
jgi:hypothetical protein